jgi:hypothetical protein
MRLEMAAAGCRSSVRRSTEPNWPHAGQEKDSHGSPAAIAAQMATIFCASAIAFRSASARFPSGAALVAARSRSCARQFGPGAVPWQSHALETNNTACGTCDVFWMGSALLRINAVRHTIARQPPRG